MYPVQRHARQILEEWAQEVASRVGRSVEDLQARGLGGNDFPLDHDLRVTLMDGSFVQFRYAFAVASDVKCAIAVFTEHCGYHIFPSHEAVVSEVHDRGE